MLTLQPQAPFTVVRQIADHTDSTTYYVQAVVRNAYTDEILETVQLTDRGGQRFSKNWQVPADASGQGFYISIVTSVYTDSGYTTKSPSYGDEENTYLVQERVLVGRGGGGGGIDGPTVRRIVREELDKLPKPEKPKTVNLAPVLDAIAQMEGKLAALKPKDVDLSSVLASLDAVKRLAQQSVDKPVTPATDLSNVETMVRDFTERFDLVIDALSAEIGETEREIVETITSAMKEEVPGVVAAAMKDVTFTIAPSTATATGVKEKEEEDDDEEEIDISKIAS